MVCVRRRIASHVEDEGRHQRAERGRACAGRWLRAVRLGAAEWWCGSVDSRAGALEPGAEDAVNYTVSLVAVQLVSVAPSVGVRFFNVETLMNGH